MTIFSSQDYLARIGLESTPDISIDGLQAIHKAQHRTIPFENFDVALGRGVDPSPEALVRKLVDSKRGGYCFELNGLLLMALTHFGFDVRPLLGRVHLSGAPTGRGHLILLVSFEGEQWIVDAGFGAQTPRAPLPLVLEQEIQIDMQTFRLLDNDLYGVMLQGQQNGEWSNLYSFDFSHVCGGDIKYGNHFTSTHPESSFVASCIAALPTDTGLVTLANQTLRIRTAGDVVEQELDGANYIESLRTHFGIELDEPYEALKPLAAIIKGA